MPIYPTDMDDLRRSVTEAAMLIVAGIIWSDHRGVVGMDECVDDAFELLTEIREKDRSKV